jgi:hypothetical protein
MPIVSNPSADRPEKLANAAQLLRASKLRRAIFELIYTGNRKWRTVQEIKDALNNQGPRVYSAASKLAAEDIIAKDDHRGGLRYGKIEFYSHNKAKILDLAANKLALEKLPTRQRPQVRTSTIVVYKTTQVRIEEVHAEAFRSFARIADLVGRRETIEPLSEKRIKEGFKALLHETGVAKDWGGELNDIFTRTTIKSRRRSVAMALKGPGTKGPLVPGKMGKNGDQIQRLFMSPAEVFVVQYYGQINPSILDLMQSLAAADSLRFHRKIYFGIIDGNDTARIRGAYPDAFRAGKKRA